VPTLRGRLVAERLLRVVTAPSRLSKLAAKRLSADTMTLKSRGRRWTGRVAQGHGATAIPLTRLDRHPDPEAGAAQFVVPHHRRRIVKTR